MIIRRLEQKDKPEMEKLYKEFHITHHREELLAHSDIREFTEYKNPDKTVAKTVKDLLTSKKYFVYIAEEKNILKGYICGEIMKKKGRVLHTEGYVSELYIQKEYRGKGIGKSLLNALVTEFKKQGCTHLGINAYAENKQATDIYRHLGFLDYVLTLKKKI